MGVGEGGPGRNAKGAREGNQIHPNKPKHTALAENTVSCSDTWIRCRDAERVCPGIVALLAQTLASLSFHSLRHTAQHSPAFREHSQQHASFDRTTEGADWLPGHHHPATTCEGDCRRCCRRVDLLCCLIGPLSFSTRLLFRDWLGFELLDI